MYCSLLIPTGPRPYLAVVMTMFVLALIKKRSFVGRG